MKERERESEREREREGVHNAGGASMGALGGISSMWFSDKLG